jgi:maltose O-acetyltransferase
MSFIKRIILKIRGHTDIKDLIKNGLTVGENVFVNFNTIIDVSFCFLIEIGNNVTLAPNVHLLAHDASTKNELGYTKVGRVSIGNNVFIGAGSIILPGTTIGNNVIIGAGSVVSTNIPENSVAVGNPAKVISTYVDYMEKNKKLLIQLKIDGDREDIEYKEKIKNETNDTRFIYVK